MEHGPVSDPMAAALLAELGQTAQTRHFAAQTVLFTEGDEGDALYILLAGRVKVYGSAPDGREVIYNLHGAGESFGELALDGAGRSASVMTLEPCQCVVVPGSQLRGFLVSHPDVALYLVKKLGALVRHSTLAVKRLALSDVYGRLRHWLLSCAQAEGEVQVVQQRLTQQQMAEHVGASREMVSRIFAQWVKGGYLRLEAKRIVLLRSLPERW